VAGAGYEVVVGPSLLDRLDALLAPHSATGYAIVTDSTVERHFAAPVLAQLQRLAPAFVAAFPAGEWNKSRDTWAGVTDQLIQHGLDRAGLIVALGGGVVGDLAGFVAATYLRGVRCAQVPTTLLAMVDSSIGGKTGVDTAAGKNLVGAFHQPVAVLADVDTLRSLPAVHVAAGAAEAIKHGVIADPEYLDRLLSAAPAIRQRDPAALFEAVRRSVEIKAAVVTEDEKERGRRAILNFGHTVGHALETAFGYELLHGEAVALGMLAEARLGAAVGVTAPSVAERVAVALETFGLPMEPPGALDLERALPAMQHDKKVRAGAVRFALPKALGEMARDAEGAWTLAVPSAAVRQVLSEWSR
jgi:3-dehydroquinate synthase